MITRISQQPVIHLKYVHMVLGAFLVSVMAFEAVAQIPDPREVSIGGAVEPNIPLWECHIAAGYNPLNLSEDREVVSVSRVTKLGTPLVNKGIGFSVARKNSQGAWEWQQEGLIPNGPEAQDPVIAHNSVSGDFLACCFVPAGTDATQIAVSNYFPRRAPFSRGWRTIGAPGNIDKPWIVSGSQDGGYQEFYIAYASGGTVRYLRTVNGGDPNDPHAWNEGPTHPNAFLFPWLATSPAATDKVFVSTADYGNRKFRFFEGTDGTDPGTGLPIVTWTQMLELDVHAVKVFGLPGGASAYNYLPLANTQTRRVYLWPNIAVDPVDANVVYLVYHDTVNANPPPNVPAGQGEKVDVFFVKLTKRGGSGTASAPVAITDPDQNPNQPSDNLHPAVVVTHGPSGTASDTRIRVVFYSDRNFDQQVDTNINDVQYHNPNAKFDVFYKYSDNGGATWQPQQELEQVPYETGVQFEHAPAPDFELNDYIGVTARPVLNGYEVWTSYMGTHLSTPSEPNDHKSVICATRIPWVSP